MTKYVCEQKFLPKICRHPKSISKASYVYSYTSYIVTEIEEVVKRRRRRLRGPSLVPLQERGGGGGSQVMR
jgi:hypothetical protein